MLSDILPANARRFEKSLTDSCDFEGNIDSVISALGRIKLIDRPADFLPFLVDEYGLQALMPYIGNLYELVDKGVPWARTRGTTAAVHEALSWLGLAAVYEPAAVSRNWWNSYTLRFIAMPQAGDLPRIEGLAALAEPLRSDFRRGVCCYDVPALEGDKTPLDGAILDNDSGLAIDKTIWSFGRAHELAHELSEAESRALGIWLKPSAKSLKWADAHFLWATADFPWADISAAARAQIMTQWFDRRRIYMCFRGGEAIIGYRACRACRACAQTYKGAYHHGQKAFEPVSQSDCVYIEALTGFNDTQADTAGADSVSLVFGFELAPDVPMGRLWLQASELKGGTEIARKPLALALRRTVREQIKILMTVSEEDDNG